MKRTLRTLTLLLPILLGVLATGCDDKDKKEPASPSIDSSDITILGKVISPSAKWLTEGQTLQITIDELNYATKSSDIVLSSIIIEKDGKRLQSAPYQLKNPINIKVDGWNHGENTINVAGLFKSPNGEIEKEICTCDFLVFDELPTYNIEGSITFQIIYEPYYYGMDYGFDSPLPYEKFYSKDHTVSYTVISYSETDPFTGIVFNTFTQISNPTLDFYIDRNSTNFNAKITKEELHWRTQDGPAYLPTDEELAKEEILFGTFSISGIHEGIELFQEATYIFRYIRGIGDQ